MLHFCNDCGKKISEGVYDYSLRHFGKALCMKHQRELKQGIDDVPKKTNPQNAKYYYCNECRKPIAYAVFKYATKNFDRPLCRGCQPEIERTFSVPPSKPELKQSTGIEIGGKRPKKKWFMTVIEIQLTTH